MWATTILSVFLAFVVEVSQGELFTSNAHLQTALYAERDIAGLLKTYVEQEEIRLQKIRQLSEEYSQHSNRALADVEKHLGNPINAFLLIKKFTLDWDRDIVPVINNSSLDSLNREMDIVRSDLPNYEDLKGAAAALMRLQDTYQLDTTVVAHGQLGGVSSPVLSAAECFELGRLSYNDGDFYHTKLWMVQALDDYKQERAARGRHPSTPRTPTRRLRGELGDMDLQERGGQWEEEEEELDEEFETVFWGADTSKAQVLDYLAFSHYKVTYECFTLGRLSYTDSDFYHCSLWMQEALDRDQETHDTQDSISKTETLDYLSYVQAVLGDLPQALKLTNELLSLDPTHERATNNKRYFEKMMEDEEKQQPLSEEDKRIQYQENRDSYRNTEEFLTYEALCRGEEIKPIKDAHRLTCRYVTNNHPLLLLQPAKEEEMHLDPWIVVYHDIVTDGEIRHVKRLATPRLNRATVQNSKTGELETAHYRISKSAWLRGEDDPVVQKLNDRMQAVTGLDLETAEELQIANYGLGGHYEPHYDFARGRPLSRLEKISGNRIATFLTYKEEKDAFKSLGTGNRIATFLNYMSEVQAGGATVFPYLGLKLYPKKGAAAFWFNLYKNGDGIHVTRHAACPVLVGIKWVANKWIHERGQEFRRPCGLEPDE